jgi:hypothetical protein
MVVSLQEKRQTMKKQELGLSQKTIEGYLRDYGERLAKDEAIAFESRARKQVETRYRNETRVLPDDYRHEQFAQLEPLLVKKPSWWRTGSLLSSFEAFLKTLLKDESDDELSRKTLLKHLKSDGERLVLDTHNRTLDYQQTFDAEVFEVLRRDAEHQNVAVMIEHNKLSLFRLSDDTPEDIRESLFGLFDQSSFIIGTNAISRHMFDHILNRALSTEQELPSKVTGLNFTLVAHSTIDLPQGVTVQQNDDQLLEKMQASILELKKHRTGLLKTHLDLLDRASRAKDGFPFIKYDLSEALEDLGYKRQRHGSLHTDTLHEHYNRVVTLSLQWINVSEVHGKKRKKYIDQTPYWVIQARRQLVEGDVVNMMQPLLLADKRAPIVTEIYMQPGMWWQVAEMSKYHLRIPRSVLELPVDGKGNETQRMALQITATLAVWIRSSQKSHAGKEVSYTVGKLLESSGILSKQDFMKYEPKTASRLRSYLVGENFSSGALGLLRNLRAFDFDIPSEQDFFSTGHGWKEKFWNAELKVRIPELVLQDSTPHQLHD